jgi:hypothetical protein
MIEVSLRYMEQVSFRQTEATSFMEFSKKHPDVVKNLKGDDAIAFVSLMGDQIVFVHGFRELASDHGIPRLALFSQRIRLTSGQWSPRMLQNYAEDVGLKLRGIKRFEEIYKEERERKANGTQE